MKSLQYRVNKDNDSYMYIILDFNGRKRTSPLRGIEHTGILPTKCVPFNVPCGTPRLHSLSSAFLDLAFCSTLGMGHGFDLLGPPVCHLYDFNSQSSVLVTHFVRAFSRLPSFLVVYALVKSASSVLSIWVLGLVFPWLLPITGLLQRPWFP